MRRTIIAAIGALALAIATSATALAAPGDPTCASVFGIAVHGQHIIGDYVIGPFGASATLDWPPSGGVVGSAIAGEGVEIAGGPGPGFHFAHGFAAGASFCLPQSQSPGVHAGH